jgi:CheY-like chemotaxis protein/HPt (histidine-containing phosphotransfer) domain-containing protein
LVTDLRMPEMDGFELVDRVNSLTGVPSVPIVVLTSGGSPGDAERARKLGVAAYLPKPIKQGDLRQAVLQAIGARPERRARLITRHTLREDGRRLRILVAEDNQVNQRLAVKLVEKWGYLPTIAGDGRQAVEELARQRFDLVLMDVQMPEMDGFEATRLIREREARDGTNVPIIAMTAHAHARDRERCLEAGMNDYVSKPINADALWNAIQSAVPQPEGDAGGTTDNEGEVVADDSKSFDEQAALARVAGDHGLLREIAGIYLDSYEEMVKGVREAVSAGDAAALKSAAHFIKGTVSNFEARRATAAARELEQMGADEQLDGAPAKLEELAREADLLADELSAYRNAG